MTHDFIDINSSNTSVAKATVRPATDGSFQFKIYFESVGNGHGTPSMTAALSETKPNTLTKAGDSIAWGDGLSGLRLLYQSSEDLQAGQTYEYTAQGNNTNAAAVRLQLSITRLPN